MWADVEIGLGIALVAAIYTGGALAVGRHLRRRRRGRP
jgi:hypothetical protein